MFGSLRRKIPQTVIISLLLSFFVPPLSQATDKDVEVISKVSRDSVTIGDEIIYALVIRSKTGINLDSIRLNLDLAPFKVKEHKTYPWAKDDKGNLVQRQDYVITIFDLGDFVIPPVRVLYMNAQSQMVEALSDWITIKVSSIGVAEDAKDIKGLKPPFKAKEKSKWLPYLIVGLISAGILSWLYLRWKGKGIALPQVAAKPEKPAWEMALTQLEELRECGYIKKNEIKRHYTVLSEIIRRYLERGLGVPAVDRTTSEIRSELKKSKIEEKVIGKTIGLLLGCDLVKFAKFVPALAQMEQDWQEAYNLVQETGSREAKPITLVQ